MTLANFNYYYQAEIYSTWVEDGVQQTFSYSFVNKPFISGITPVIPAVHIPILRSIGEVSLNAGEYLPSISLSSIEIDNSRGSMGSNRRFSDILERKNIIGQKAVISILEMPNDSDSDGTWVVIATGKIDSYSLGLSSGEHTLTFQISPIQLDDAIVTLEVSRGVPGMEDAPQGSLGRSLPIVLDRDTSNLDIPRSGVQEVPGVRISADGSTSPKYALSTLFSGFTTVFSTSLYSVFFKKVWDDRQSQWHEQDIFAGGYLPPIEMHTPTSGASYYSLMTNASIAFQIPSSELQYGTIATQIIVYCKGSSTNPARQSGAALSVIIYAVNRASKEVVGELGRGKVALSIYDSLNNVSASEIQVKVDLDKPVVIPNATSDYDYYVGFEGTGVLSEDLVIKKYTGGGATTYGVVYKPNSVTAGNSYNNWLTSTDTTCAAFKTANITAALQDAGTPTTDGLSYSQLVITCPTPEAGQLAPSWDSTEIVVKMVGSEDAGPYNLVNTNPVNLCSILCRPKFDGNWLSPSNLDSFALSTEYDQLFKHNGSHRGRGVAGIIEGRVTRGEALIAIARATGCRFGIKADGKLFLYPWGYPASFVYDIPYGDILPVSWDVRDGSSIINDVSFFFDKRFATSDSDEGFGESINYSLLGSYAFDARTDDSFTSYGLRPLVDNKFPTYGFASQTAEMGTSKIGLPGYLGGNQMDFLADYYVSRFAKGLVYCSFVVPYHRYKNIRMFDTITFAHPDFPAFWGTDPSPRDPPVNTGTSVVPVPNANKGHELIRAQTYRGLVEGVSYVLAMEHAPAIRLTVQVLLNQGFDPT